MQERIKIMEAYFATKSLIHTQRQFRRDFPIRNAPTRATILHLLNKFWETESVHDKNKGQSGRPRSARTDPNINNVRQHLAMSPRKSTRLLSQETDRSKTSVKRIMHQDLHRFPYKIQILQARTAASKAERLAFCQSTSPRIGDHPYFLDLIFFRDEAHFHLSRHVNKQNTRYLAQAQSHEHFDLHSYLEHFQFP